MLTLSQIEETKVMDNIATRTIYPITCPNCQTNTARTAEELLNKEQVECRDCGTVIDLNENRVEAINRALEYLDQLGKIQTQIKKRKKSGLLEALTG